MVSNLVEEYVLKGFRKILMIMEVRGGRKELSINNRHGQRAE